MLLSLTSKLCLRVLSLSFLFLVSMSQSLMAQSAPRVETQAPTDSFEPERRRETPRRRDQTPVFSGQQSQQEAVVPLGDQEIITDIVVRFVDAEGNLIAGKTQPEIILQEFALQPGDIYRADLAKEGLEGVLDLIIVNRASVALENTGAGQAIMAIAVQENSDLGIGFGLTLPPPTALQGVVRPVTVNALSDSPNGFDVGVQVGLLNLGGRNQGVNLGVEAGTDTFGFDLGYRRFLRHDRGFGVNVFNRRGVEAEFDDGDPNVNLDNDQDPFVHRLGGGVEYFAPIAEDWQGAIGISYQRVSVRDGVFSSNVEAEDALGNSLTVSEDGQDDLLTLNFATVLNREDNPNNPTGGYKFQFSSDQYLPIGDANIVANRLAANYTQYLPVPLFGFTQGARTLVLNIQGGTILGDAIPYDSFILGGSSTVRGYDTSEISTGRSFLQGTAEYRYPITAINAFNNNIDLGGTLFIDYATDLGSADAVIGQPAVVRDRPGDGFGYGLGLRAITPVGAIRTEFAINDQGDTEVTFSIGDRF